jgi:FtsP/CotA-like multicopper oxidase with cupredoxin domain
MMSADVHPIINQTELGGMPLNRRRFVVGSALSAGAGIALVADGCSTGGLAGAPFPAPGSTSYTLNVAYATNTVGGFPMRTRTYNGGTFGPTMECNPGSTLAVTVNNNLPPNPQQNLPQGHVLVPTYASMEDMMMRRPSGHRMSSGPWDPMNNPHSFNTTNLHVHGIQTIPHLYDPIGTSDPMSKMIAIEPGSSMTYTFPIPPDHPSGLFWYHPHHHGSTDVQVSGGMAGLIIVRGAIDQVPEIAAARELLLVIQSLQVNGPDSHGVYSYDPVAYTAAANGYGNVQYAMITANGQGICWVNQNTNAQQQLGVPTFTMAPGEVVRLRMLNGTNGFYLPLVFPGMNCYLIGFDGINTLAPNPAVLNFPKTPGVNAVNMNAAGTNVLSTAPGNRIEMLIQAPTTPGTYTLSSVANNGIEFPLASFDIANFVVTGAPKTMSIPASLPQPSREYPLIADTEIVNRRTLQFHQSITQPPGFLDLFTGFWPYINNALFDEMAINYNLTLGTAEEWTIINQTSCGHPFHLHENSFELIEVNGVPVPPSFWDTFMVPPAQVLNNPNQDGSSPAGSIKIRIRFKGWRGKTVFHCHILGHEDTGMMNNILLS